MNDVSYFASMLEEIRDQNRAVLEAVADIRRVVDDQPTRQEFNDLKQEVRTIRIAITETNAVVQITNNV